MIRISIIIPAYNVAPWISATLLSIYRSRNVDLTTIEVIVVNDGSKDDTINVVELFASNHQELKVKLISQDNQGVSQARNNGLHNAQGEYVWFIDGDDMITSNAIHDILGIIDTHPDVDVLKTGTPVKFSDESELADTADHTAPVAKLCKAYELFNEQYGSAYICHVRHIWRRELLENYRLEYPAGIVTNEDFCFTIQSLLKADTAYDVPELQVYLYRQHDGSATNTRCNPDHFQHKVLSAQKALQIILGLCNVPSAETDSLKEKACQRVRNLMIATNICHILDPLSFSFVRSMLKNLEEMNAYPFVPETDHSRLLRFVMQRKWAIIAVSQYRRIKYLINLHKQ